MLEIEGRQASSASQHQVAMYLSFCSLLCVRLLCAQGIATVSGTYKSVPWTRSKALLGSITGIERARVCELANPEPDRPLAPHWRATVLSL